MRIILKSNEMSSIRDFFPIEYKVGGTKPKKNFLIENRKYVSKIAKTTKESKENKDPSNKLSSTNVQKFKLRDISNKDSVSRVSKNQVKSINLDKIDASIESIRSALAEIKVTQKKLNTKSCEKLSIAFRNQATQTINPYNEDDVLKDSIIRYSKSENSNMFKCTQIKHMNTIAVQTESSESKMDFNSIEHNKIDFKKNQSSLVEIKKHIVNHHQPGELPKYLKNRKALKDKCEKETQKNLAIRHELGLDDPACPPGHVLLPELERLNHLDKIKKDYNSLINELNKLPMSSDSFKMKEKRKLIEKEMDKLQLGIKLFSKKKLYVKVNPKMSNK